MNIIRKRKRSYHKKLLRSFSFSRHSGKDRIETERECWCWYRFFGESNCGKLLVFYYEEKKFISKQFSCLQTVWFLRKNFWAVTAVRQEVLISKKKIVWIAILFIFKFVQFPPFAIGGKGFFPEFFLFFSKQSESFSEKMGEKSFPDGEKRWHEQNIYLYCIINEEIKKGNWSKFECVRLLVNKIAKIIFN